MEKLALQDIRGCPYRSIGWVADNLGITKRTVATKIKGIEQEIERGRYNPYVIANDGGSVLINIYAFIDYITYRKRLEDKNMRKYVPEFKPKQVAENCGWEE